MQFAKICHLGNWKIAKVIFHFKWNKRHQRTIAQLKYWIKYEDEKYDWKEQKYGQQLPIPKHSNSESEIPFYNSYKDVFEYTSSNNVWKMCKDITFTTIQEALSWLHFCLSQVRHLSPTPSHHSRNTTLQCLVPFNFTVLMTTWAFRHMSYSKSWVIIYITLDIQIQWIKHILKSALRGSETSLDYSVILLYLLKTK